jgi:hypothetical protein
MTAVALSGDYLPSGIDDSTLQSILDDIATGIATYRAVESYGINRRTFYARLAIDADAANRYTRARMAGCHAYADETFEIQDETPPTVPTKFGDVTDSAWVAWQRNRVELRKWHLSKLMPKVYGDKLELSGDANNPIAIVVSPQDDKL